MAIVQQGAGWAGASVQNGYLFQSKAGKSATMQKANNNRNSKSANFQNLDALISQLDAQFDQLPNQSDWITYAANIAGDWQLCANCEPVSSGKKLFRQYNLNRYVLGLAYITVPVSNTAYSASSLQLAEAYHTGGGAQGTFTGVANFPAAAYIFSIVGSSLLNPFVLFPAGWASNQFQSSGAVFDWILATVKALDSAYPGTSGSAEIPYCQCDINGAPGKRIGIDVLWS